MARGPSIVKVLMLQRTMVIYELCTVDKHSGIPIFRTPKENEDWFEKSGKTYSVQLSGGKRLLKNREVQEIEGKCIVFE